jgi:hypothetical protein
MLPLRRSIHRELGETGHFNIKIVRLSWRQGFAVPGLTIDTECIGSELRTE